MKTKKCAGCKDDKKLEEFPWKNKSKGTKSTRCYDCQREYSKKHYRENKRKYLDRNNRRRENVRKENRKFLKEYFEKHPCIDCGETDIRVLQFDHVRGKKKFNISSRIRDWPVDELMDEIAKCEIRCANCHFKKTSDELGWWYSKDP